MKRVHTETYTVLSAFACYIEYSETEGLNRAEIKGFDWLEGEAIKNAPEGFKFSYWSITDEHDEFTRCDATDIMGECILIEAVYFNDEA
jgi:hypothetical protein